MTRRSGAGSRSARARESHDRAKPELCPHRATAPPAAYAYLLGQYLGDGHVATHRRGVGRLTISCCAAYPGIVAECAASMAAVLPNRVWTRSRPGSINVSSYSTHWWCLLLQTGVGRKHLRPIVLEPWQQRFVEDEAAMFLRGLVHSDGCRSLNTVRTRTADGVREYRYPRYSFSNRSEDIRRLFTDACDRLGVG